MPGQNTYQLCSHKVNSAKRSVLLYILKSAVLTTFITMHMDIISHITRAIIGLWIETYFSPEYLSLSGSESKHLVVSSKL